VVKIVAAGQSDVTYIHNLF